MHVFSKFFTPNTCYLHNLNFIYLFKTKLSSQLCFSPAAVASLGARFLAASRDRGSLSGPHVFTFLFSFRLWWDSVGIGLLRSGDNGLSPPTPALWVRLPPWLYNFRPSFPAPSDSSPGLLGQGGQGAPAELWVSETTPLPGTKVGLSQAGASREPPRLSSQGGKRGKAGGRRGRRGAPAVPERGPLEVGGFPTRGAVGIKCSEAVNRDQGTVSGR